MRGRRESVAIREIASGRVSWVDGRRQIVVPERLFGDMVRVMA